MAGRPSVSLSEGSSFNPTITDNSRAQFAIVGVEFARLSARSPAITMFGDDDLRPTELPAFRGRVYGDGGSSGGWVGGCLVGFG